MVWNLCEQITKCRECEINTIHGLLFEVLKLNHSVRQNFIGTQYSLIGFNQILNDVHSDYISQVVKFMHKKETINITVITNKDKLIVTQYHK